MSKTFRISVCVKGTGNARTEGGLQVRYFRTDASDFVQAIERFIYSEGLMELAAWRYDRWREAYRKMETWMSPFFSPSRRTVRLELQKLQWSDVRGEYISHEGGFWISAEEFQIQP